MKPPLFLLFLLVNHLSIESPIAQAKSTAAATTVVQWLPPFQRMAAAQPQPYQLLTSAQKKWRICALYPHLKDSYWLSINYGMVVQARKLGLDLRVMEAGGYLNTDKQHQQLDSCVRWQADAILLGSVSAGALDRKITQISQNVSVFATVNHLDSLVIAGKVGVQWRDMGLRLGEFLAMRHPPGSTPVQLAWLPGPEARGGSDLTEQGLRQALQGSAVELRAIRRGDNDKVVQRHLLQAVLDQFPEVDYIAGSAVAAEVAISELRLRGLTDKVGILSHYLSHGVYRGVRRGKILMANTDHMVLQGRLAIDQAVRKLEKQPYLLDMGPMIQTITPATFRDLDVDDSLSPANFRPVYAVTAEMKLP